MSLVSRHERRPAGGDRHALASRPDRWDLPVELDLPDELVTGEAVALDLRPASFASRALAIALDLLILVVGGWIVGVYLLSLLFALDDAAAAAVVLVTEVGILVGVPVTVETLTRGRSLGKLAAGLRVVRDDGGPDPVPARLDPRAARRPGVLPQLREHPADRVADEQAGKAGGRHPRRDVRGAGPRRTPAAAAGRNATGAGRLGPQRRHRPDPRPARDGRAAVPRPAPTRFTRPHANGSAWGWPPQVAQYVAPAPPAGVYPERFLAAVMAERRRRDLDRLLGEQAARFAARAATAGGVPPVAHRDPA